jgi:hypothetical protein
MLRNLVIDTETGRTKTGAPLGADIVDVVVRADVFGKEPQFIGTLYLYAGELDAAHCQAWLGITGGPGTASAVLTLHDLDTGDSLMTLTKQGAVGAAFPGANLIVPEAGWYAIRLHSTNMKSTASVYGLHLAFKGAV